MSELDRLSSRIVNDIIKSAVEGVAGRKRVHVLENTRGRPSSLVLEYEEREVLPGEPDVWYLQQVFVRRREEQAFRVLSLFDLVQLPNGFQGYIVAIVLDLANRSYRALLHRHELNVGCVGKPFFALLSTMNAIGCASVTLKKHLRGVGVEFLAQRRKRIANKTGSQESAAADHEDTVAHSKKAKKPKRKDVPSRKSARSAATPQPAKPKKGKGKGVAQTAERRAQTAEKRASALAKQLQKVTDQLAKEREKSRKRKREESSSKQSSKSGKKRTKPTKTDDEPRAASATVPTASPASNGASLRVLAGPPRSEAMNSEPDAAPAASGPAHTQPHLHAHTPSTAASHEHPHMHTHAHPLEHQHSTVFPPVPYLPPATCPWPGSAQPHHFGPCPSCRAIACCCMLP